VLQRTPIAGGAGPEFISVTLLPGRGMNVLQIMANLPRKGDVELMASPSLGEAAKTLSRTGQDVDGGGSLTMGGAIEAPWAGRMAGAMFPDGNSLSAVWRGRHINLPTSIKDSDMTGQGVAEGGLLLGRAADDVTTNVMPDGGEAKAVYRAEDFDGHWLSQTQITTTMQLSSKALEMKVVAKNTGGEPEPIGIGWHPRFAIVSKHREQAALRLPNGMRAEIRDRRSGLPTGKLIPVEGTEYDFTRADGKPLGTLGLDDSFVHLRPQVLDNGATAELRDPESNYGLRVTALSSNIKAMHVFAPAGAQFVSIDPQFNYDDPFGREWGKDEDTGMVVLQPGQSVQWVVRLEIFPVTDGDPQHL
jgi:aldose 1-epimerase